MFDILLVVIGAVLGFILSIMTTYVNKAIDKSGKIYIFTKPAFVKANKIPIEIFDNDYNKVITVPLYFEFQNTTSTSRVLRDVCLYLYKNGNEVCKMVQINRMERKPLSNNRESEVREISVKEYGGEKNSYSFVLPPSSIQKVECDFVFKVPNSKLDDYSFDEIRFAYYDEKNKQMECVFYSTPNGWNETNFDFQNDYIELICKKKRK